MDVVTHGLEGGMDVVISDLEWKEGWIDGCSDTQSEGRLDGFQQTMNEQTNE